MHSPAMLRMIPAVYLRRIPKTRPVMVTGKPINGINHATRPTSPNTRDGVLLRCPADVFPVFGLYGRPPTDAEAARTAAGTVGKPAAADHFRM